LKVILFANSDWYLFNFRLPLAEALRKTGVDVVLVSPPGSYSRRLMNEGFRWIPFDFSRKGINPFGEAIMIVRLIRLYRTERPDLCHHFTIKCVLYGAIAARLAGVKAIVSSLNGLGHLFTSETFRSFVLKTAIVPVYRFVLSRSEVIFQNPDDLQRMRSDRLVTEGHCHLIRGSGVDLMRFCPAAEPATPPIRILFVARLLKDKGILDFCEAAMTLRAQGVLARFIVAGELDPGNPSSIDVKMLGRLKEKGVVEFLGQRDDMPTLMQSAHVVCLPSYYGEGVPRSLIEGAACGLPLVTCDAPGCREAVVDGENGILVPPRDPIALAAALRRLIVDPELRARMGHSSRVRAKERFSQATVIKETIGVYQAALSKP